MPTTFKYNKGATDLSAAATWNPATAPSTPWASGDAVLFAEGGPVTFTIPAALEAIALATATFQPAFTSNIGSSSSGLQLDLSNGTGRLDLNFGGQYAYFNGNGNTWKEIWIRPVNAALVYINNVANSTIFYASSGTTKIGADTTLVDGRIQGTAAVDIPGHTGGTDEVGDWLLCGRSTVYLARKIATTKVWRVQAGCKLTLDFDGTHDGVVYLDGGEVDVRVGTLTIIGNSGKINARSYRGTGTLTITDTPDLVEEYGPNKPTISRTATFGSGSTVRNS